MIRNRILMLLCCFAPAVTVAQVPPPAPAPAPVPAPPAPPVVGVAPVAPIPPRPPEPFIFDFDSDAAQIAADAAQIAADAAQIGLEDIGPRVAAKIATKFDTAFFQRGTRFANSDDRRYESGQSALDRGQWSTALTDFTEVANRGGSRADGALYWKAYALNKLGRRDEALAAVAELRKSYASSRWLDDANALEIEVKQAAGQNVSPEGQPDEELKLMALNALVNSDPDRALPLLENLLKSSQSLRLKERALFVLAQSGAPRAQELLQQIAKGGGNPDLQLKAIQYMGTVGRKQGGGQALFDIYNAATDENVKRAVLRAFLTSGDTDHLLQVVRSEKSTELKAEGIRYLAGKTETGDALAALWAAEQDQQVKRAILDALSGQRNAKAMINLARNEKDPATKKQIVQRLSTMQSKEANDYFMELLNPPGATPK
jgi:hypothetical protein